MERLTVREACRQRHPLDGADAQALEHALTMTEKERDDAQKEAELQRGFARMHEHVYERCGVINRALRHALQTAQAKIKATQDEGVGTPADDAMPDIQHALGLTPAKAEQVVDAMEDVIDAAKAVASKTPLDPLGVALAALHKIKSELAEQEAR